jgi:AcrR family transcriptional regulator
VSTPLSRDRIVTRAIEVVDEAGFEALTLRSLAADLGVSAPAFYDHIESKDDLLRAVAEVGYAELSERFRAAALDDPVEHLRATANAYVDFALARPGRFRLMFQYRPEAVSGRDELAHPAASVVFDHGLAAVAGVIGSGRMAGDPLEQAMALWAAIHGVAVVLLMSSELGKERWLADRVLDGLLAGWRDVHDAGAPSDRSP